MTDTVNYGPLQALIGEWQGGSGMDVAPEPDGQEQNPYFESLVFEAAGDVTNAESQTLAVLRYHQVVTRKSDQKVFHDQVGYWVWDPKTDTVVQSLTIPRAVCVLAGGQVTAYDTDNTALDVSARSGDPDWGIVQSPFMRDNAKTTAFSHRIKVQGDKLSYSETTSLDIYGKSFEHTDENTLTRC